MKKRITLKDIAKILDVSVTTISRAMNDKPDVSELTRHKVKKLIKAFNYEPNTFALNFRQHKSGIIGVIVPRVTHYYFSTVFSGILNVANKKGYSIMLFESGHIVEKEKEHIDKLISNNVDGILIALSNTTNTYEHLQKINEYGIPLLLFDKTSEHFNATKVVVDDTHGAFMAVEHLIKDGRKNIAHIKGAKASSNARKRLVGYIQALKKYNMKINDELIVECKKVNEKEGYLLTRKLLTSGNRPDAFFAVTDEVAVGVIKALKEENMRIPDKVAVVGFSDSNVASVVEPQLTTVRQPGYRMGKRAFQILVDKIENKDNKIFTEVLKTKLIIRDSTRSKPKKIQIHTQ